MTVEEIYKKINKTKEHWSIWVYSMDGMTNYAYINNCYKLDAVSEEIKECEVEEILLGNDSLFLMIQI